MLSFQKIKAMKKIKEEYKDINSNPISNIGVTVGLPDDDNIFEWRATLMGPKDTSYAKGLFFLKIHFPDNYPDSAPEINFITPIYHININPRIPTSSESEPLGHVCISTLNWWKPIYNMREVLTNIFALFYLGNPESPYGLDRADEFKYNRALYEEKAKYFTQKYADPSIGSKEWNNDWDFSYFY